MEPGGYELIVAWPECDPSDPLSQGCGGATVVTPGFALWLEDAP